MTSPINFQQYLTESAKKSSRKGGKVHLYLTPAIFRELDALEMETLDPASPQEKHELVAALDSRQCLAKGKCKIIIDDRTLKYVREQFLPNALDIARDQGNRRLESALRTFESNISHL